MTRRTKSLGGRWLIEKQSQADLHGALAVAYAGSCQRLKAHKQLPVLRKALLERQAKLASNNHLAQSA